MDTHTPVPHLLNQDQDQDQGRKVKAKSVAEEVESPTVPYLVVEPGGAGSPVHTAVESIALGSAT